jgi:hypothetical protein
MMRTTYTSMPKPKCPKCKCTSFFEWYENYDVNDFDNTVLYNWKACNNCRLMVCEKWRLLESEVLDKNSGTITKLPALHYAMTS